MKFNKNTIRKNSGFGLVEVMLAIIVVAILGNFAYGRYTSSREDTKAEQEKGDIISTMGKLQDKFSSHPDYSTVTLQVLIDNGVFPSHVSRGTTVTNQFSGNVTVTKVTTINADDSVKFTTDNYSLDGCRSVVPKIDSGSVSISVNGTQVKAPNAKLLMDKLGQACTTASKIEYVVAK